MRIELQYALAFSLAAVIIVAGFWPSFYADPTQNEPFRTVHGLWATGWLLIMVTQPWLIATGRFGWHRRLGAIARLWFAALAVSILVAVWRMLSEPRGVGDGLTARQAVGFVNLVGLPVIVAMFVLAIRAAKAGRIADHRRYLACVVAVILPTGMVRLVTAITGQFSPLNIAGVGLLVGLVILAIAIRDRLASGVWFKPYLWTIAASVGPLMLVPLVIDAPLWLGIVRLVGYPG
ncbi:hypothetical protein [Novosphingobium sp. FKTRR1]|uniref:hypothetical protein n=1 Tax=Novosphingobium sp. FKTRR1 TaxID=2879118 RepID=UPI001CEFF5DB|nr:hypothetical protein [Novosphingobium sp. FKTRR1]